MATNIFKLQAVTWEQSPLHTALYGNTRNAQEGAEMTVDWGDGTVQTNQDITPMHETAEGVYTVTLTYNDKITYYIDGTAIYPTQVLSLVEAVLDESTVIEGNAFRGCWYLTKLTLGATVPPTLGEDAFASANNLTAIYVPYSAVNAYKTAAVWSTFADIIRGYFPMKTVQSGAHYTTVTVDTAEEVKFSFPSTSLSVEAAGGDITVALTDTAQAGDDETITVPDGESRMFIHHRMNIDTYYLTGSGTATLYASNMGDVNPFEGKSKGGDGGGDNTHYKGTTTTPLENGSTTNPIVIDGESYTAVFGDVVVYGYTEFVFDGTQWSEFGRPFDTVPTQGSTNAVTSDGIYAVTPFARGQGTGSAVGGTGNYAYNSYATVVGQNNATSALSSFVAGKNNSVSNSSDAPVVFGLFNNWTPQDLFEVGNGASKNERSNILEVNRTSANVNGDIKINNVEIPTPYTTMPTITESMLGKIAMYVGVTGGGFTQGCFYVASTDGAAEPTYSWTQIGGGTLGIEDVVLWENDGTTNPDTITLSEAWSDFDELITVTDWIENNTHVWGYNTVQNIYNSGDVIRMWYYDNTVFSMYTVTSSTVLTKYALEGSNWIYKIIGRRYTRANPTGYRQTVLWENTGTNNPDTITLSEAWSNFDELVVVIVSVGSASQYETAKHTSVMAIGGTYTLWYNSEKTWGRYSTTSSTVFTKISSGGDYHIAKIIGIKY